MEWRLDCMESRLGYCREKNGILHHVNVAILNRMCKFLPLLFTNQPGICSSACAQSVQTIDHGHSSCVSSGDGDEGEGTLNRVTSLQHFMYSRLLLE